MNTIRQLCDRCVVLEKGKIVFEGNVDAAISLYLNRNDRATSTVMDLTSIPRPPNATKSVSMQQIQFLDRSDCVLIRGEPLKFQLAWISKSELKDVKLRLKYISEQCGIRSGCYCCCPLYLLCATDCLVVRFYTRGK